MELCQRGHREGRGADVQCGQKAMTLTGQGQGGPPRAAVIPDPSPAELAQCQVEMGTLLTSIAELNKKIGKLKVPSEPEDFKPSRVSKPLLSGLRPHRLLSGGQEKRAAPGPQPQTPLNREVRRELWPKLQKALTAVERSINTRRKWAILTTATDLVRQTEHLVAAEASTTQTTQILEEIESDLGISFPPATANVECPQGRDIQSLNSSFQEETNPPARPSSTAIPQMEEMSSLRKKLEGLQRAWSSGSPSPLYSPSGCSPCGPRSPELASPPPYLGSPLLLRRPMRAFTAPLSTVRDNSPPASPRPAGALLAPSASPTSSSASSQESETERLQRCIERLRARNRRLTTALEGRKGEPQQAQPPLGGGQVDSSTLQMALAYCQECEEAYSELLSLYELNKQQGVEVCQSPASGPAGGLQLPASPPHRFRSEAVGREAALRQHIECLKRDRTATRLPRPGGEGERAPVLDPGPTPGRSRDGFEAKEARHARAGKETGLPLDELQTVGEEMAERSAETHLAEEELRCLDWALQALKAQDSAAAHPLPLPPQSPRVEPRHRAKAEPQADNGHLTRPQKKANQEELHALFQREHGLKKRLSLVRESLAAALRDSAPHGQDGDKHNSRRAASSHRSSRRRYQEQVWRLEQKVAAMSQSHQSQIAGLKATVEALESRREETAL